MRFGGSYKFYPLGKMVFASINRLLNGHISAPYQSFPLYVFLRVVIKYAYIYYVLTIST